jgi:hypothetical protein
LCVHWPGFWEALKCTRCQGKLEWCRSHRCDLDNYVGRKVFYVTLRRDYNMIRDTAEQHEWLKEWNDNNITN